MADATPALDREELVVRSCAKNLWCEVAPTSFLRSRDRSRYVVPLCTTSATALVLGQIVPPRGSTRPLKYSVWFQSIVLETAGLFFLKAELSELLPRRTQVQHLQQEGTQRASDALVDGERPARNWTAVRLPSVVDEAAQGA